jgi:hypothetical protein
MWYIHLSFYLYGIILVEWFGLHIIFTIIGFFIKLKKSPI